MKISQIKKLSRKIIKGSVKNSSRFLLAFIAGTVLFSVLPFLADFFFSENIIVSLSVLVCILVLNVGFFSSLRTGSRAWFLFYNRKKRGSKALFWLKPSKTTGCVKLYVSLFFRKLMWTIAFLSPGAAVASAAVIIAMSGGVEFNLFATWLAGGTVLMITGLCFLYFFLQRYFLVPYIKAANPSMKNREIFLKSRCCMSDSAKQTALLKISFLPWAALSFTVIPAFYVWTYYSQSCALMAAEIYRKDSGRLPDNSNILVSAEKNTDSG